MTQSTVREILNSFNDDIVDMVIAHDECANLRTQQTGSSFRIDSIDQVDGYQNDTYKTDYAKQIRTTARKRFSFGDFASMDNISSLDVTNGASTLGHSTLNSNNRRKSSTNRFDLTPLYNPSEYVPVYANRTPSLTNTISDDEKWQILSKKRYEALSEKSCYSLQPSASTSNINVKGNSEIDKNTNKAIYELYKPTDYNNAAGDGATSAKHLSPHYRSIRITKKLDIFECNNSGDSMLSMPINRLQKSQTDSNLFGSLSDLNDLTSEMLNNETTTSISENNLSCESSDGMYILSINDSHTIMNDFT